MQWKVVLGPAWAEAEGMSDSDIASLFGIDLAGAVPAGTDDLCPRCRNHSADSHVQLFASQPATAPEQVKGRAIVKCLCGTTYWYAAVHEVDVHQPIGQASVRAASASRPVVLPPPLFPPGLTVPSVRQQMDDGVWLHHTRERQQQFYAAVNQNPDDAGGPVYYRRPRPTMTALVEGQCPVCKKPLGPLHPTEEVAGVRQHRQPCPETARPTGERAFPFLPQFPPTGD